MNLCFVLGTRPEIIKLSPLIKLCKKKNIQFNTIHTRQHYDFNMERQFFKEFKVKPNFFLSINRKNKSNKKFLSKTVIQLTKLYKKLNPDYIISQGDTNTVLASVLAYNKVKKKIKARMVHVEAGIRSYDNSMPEEYNRIMADKYSQFLFAPTVIAKKNIIKEKLSNKKIFVVGNTISDTITQFKTVKAKKKGFFYLTLHRPETVDNLSRLKTVIQTMINISKKYDIDIFFPIHPRTKQKVSKLKLKNLKVLKIIEPCSYKKSLYYQKNSKIVITDSGGLQEESCILQTPCVTIRNNTERPETIKIGSNILAGYKSNVIEKSINKMLKTKKKWVSPYGKLVSQKILHILKSNIINEV